jgi:hypothetical protein
VLAETCGTLIANLPVAANADHDRVHERTHHAARRLPGQVSRCVRRTPIDLTIDLLAAASAPEP